MKIRTVLKVARSGDVRARVAAIRDAQAAVRVAAVTAGLRTGTLDHLRSGPDSVAGIAGKRGWSDQVVVEGLLQVLAMLGLVERRGSTWGLTRRGSALLEDDVARATYEGFGGYHVGLYGGIERQLGGGPPRQDVVEHGDIIARVARAMDPFVADALTREIARNRPRRILDVGCGSGSHLTHLLTAVPEATGVGIETDHGAATIARMALTDHGLAGRASVVEGDVRQVLDPSLGSFDLALLANVVYYFPPAERVDLLRAVADRLERGGALVVVTTVLTDALFSRHLDLLLRVQEGDMGLPSTEELCDQLRSAGLAPERPRRISPGEPLTAVVARRR